MDKTYATAKVAYAELRAAVGPWTSANGFKRTKGTQAGWEKPLDAERLLSFRFEGYTYVVSDTGNSYHGYVQLDPIAERGRTILRQAGFELCLVQAELDELSRIQGAINRRRPPVPDDLQQYVNQDSLIGLGLREDHDPAPRYFEGKGIHFGYHTLQDTRDLAAFVARVLPAALERFLDGRVHKPIDDTPPHLKPKWLRNLSPGPGSG